jgi:hypothetical protein
MGERSGYQRHPVAAGVMNAFASMPWFMLVQNACLLVQNRCLLVQCWFSFNHKKPSKTVR